ncbi:unnamed protein product [Phaeothamnion confervicola]
MASKHVLVIGAGASGLAVMKEAKELGHRVTCFEMALVIGGVYAKTYDCTTLTTSSCLTAFSDYSDGKEACPTYWTANELLAYFDGFAKKFELYKNISFKTKVERLQRCAETGE